MSATASWKPRDVREGAGMSEPLVIVGNGMAAMRLVENLTQRALGSAPTPRDGVGAFISLQFNAADVAGYVSAWRLKRPGRPRLSLVH